MRSLMACLVGASIGFYTLRAEAQCTKDTDCKGDRVCDAGQCLAPVPPAGEESAQAPAAADEPASPPPAAAAPPPPPAEATPKANLMERKMRASSMPLVVLGVVTLSAAGITLYGAYASVIVASGCHGYYSRSSCDDAEELAVGFSLASLGLIAVGIPLIVVGSKRVPDESAERTALRAPKRVEAAIAPFVTPESAGLGLNLAF